MTLGHLKPGVTPAQATADLNSIGAYLEKTYPNDDGQMTFTLARPGLAGDWLGRPLRAFLAGLMLLAGLILLAACANLGSLFAARAADRSREVAMRLALGSGRVRILRTTFYRSRADFAARRSGRTLGECGAVAWAERVATASDGSPHDTCESRRTCLLVRIAAGVSEWFPIWRGANQAGAPYKSVRGREGGIIREGCAAGYRPRRVAGGANCDLRGAGHFFAGRRAWNGALATQQFRF